MFGLGITEYIIIIGLCGAVIAGLVALVVFLVIMLRRKQED